MKKEDITIVTNRGGQRILVLTPHYRKLEYIPPREDYDAILYESTSNRLVEFQLSQLDPVLNHSSQFKPFFINPQLDGGIIIKLMADGLFLSPNDEGLIDEVNRIQDRIKELKIDITLPYLHHTEEAAFGRIIRWLLTRHSYIPTPVLKFGSSFGYLYPTLEFYMKYKKVSAKYVANRILSLQASSYIENIGLIDKAPLCRNCFRSHLVFSETCPYCSASDIHLEEAIHHFQCANISPEGSYIKGDNLVCPKCRKQLRHIGVDYDRPSALYHCRTCSHSFSKPKMRVTCTSCTSIHTPDTLLFLPIHERVDFTQEGIEVFTKSENVDDDSTAYPLLVDFYMYQSYLRSRVAIYGVFENEDNAVTVTEVHDALDKEYIHELCRTINRLDPNAVLAYKRGTLHVVQLGKHAVHVFANNFAALKEVSRKKLGIDEFFYESITITSPLQGAEYINAIND